jgi:hypothetical protein
LQLKFNYSIKSPVLCCLWGDKTEEGNYTGLVGDLESHSHLHNNYNNV